MSRFHQTVTRFLNGEGKPARPPRWLIAPHLRGGEGRPAMPAALPRTAQERPTAAPAKPIRTRPVPFPLWCDDCGEPLARLLGPPWWRNLSRS